MWPEVPTGTRSHGSAAKQNPAAAAHELGQAVQNDVGAQLRRGQQQRAERVVDDEPRPVSVRDGGERREVGHHERRVGHAFDVEQARALGERRRQQVDAAAETSRMAIPAPAERAEQPEMRAFLVASVAVVAQTESSHLTLHSGAARAAR